MFTDIGGGRELAGFLKENPKLEIAGDTLEEPSLGVLFLVFVGFSGPKKLSKVMCLLCFPDLLLGTFCALERGCVHHVPSCELKCGSM